MSDTSQQRIVVGIDGSKESIAALHWAVEEAARRDASVEVIHAWHFIYVGDPMGAAIMASAKDLEGAAEQVVAEALAAVASEGVKVTGRTVEGAPARILIDASKDAELLVVGRRGRGGFLGLLLGSVAQQLAHHASCPLVLVPSLAA